MNYDKEILYYTGNLLAIPEADSYAGPMTVCLNQSDNKHLRLKFLTQSLIILDKFLERLFVCWNSVYKLVTLVKNYFFFKVLQIYMIEPVKVYFK